MKIDLFALKRKFGQPGTIVNMGPEGLALVIDVWVDNDQLHMQVISAYKIGQGSTDLLTFDRQQADQISRWRRATAREFSRELQCIFDNINFGCNICGQKVTDLTTAEIICPTCQHDHAAPIYVDLAEMAA